MQRAQARGQPNFTRQHRHTHRLILWSLLFLFDETFHIQAPLEVPTGCRQAAESINADWPSGKLSFQICAPFRV